MNNLPPVLPTGGSSTTPSRPQTSIRRNAGDLKVSSTQQKRDIEGASVSMNQAMNKKAGVLPTTSITHVGQNANTISTSVNSGNNARHSIYEGETAEEERNRDYRRDSYIRRLIKKRKAAEVQVAKKVAKAKSGIQAGIGSGFRKTGVTSFRRRMEKMFHTNRATYKNLSAKDKKMFEDIVEGHLSKKATGKAINRLDRRKMGMDVFKKWQNGEITKNDYQDMKKIIGELE